MVPWRSGSIGVPRVAVAAAVALVLTGCGRRDGGRVVSAESSAIDAVLARPTFTLRDTDGKPFDFRARTAGLLTFVEFGYTHCPDVCPVHMANLAAVIGKIEPSERMRIAVVFISIDPDRDSAAVLRKWLDAFDVQFIGLTGTREELDAAQKAVGFAPAIVQASAPGAAPTVNHAAPVVVFTADDSAHVMYPFGTRQSDWTRDIPRLLAVERNDASRVSADRAYVVIPAGGGPAAIYLVARVSADSLVAIDAPGLGPVTLHQSAQHDGMMAMEARTAVPSDARGTIRLAPGGFHAMVSLARPLSRGDRIGLTLRFAHHGNLPVLATAITYADVDSATSPR